MAGFEPWTPDIALDQSVTELFLFSLFVFKLNKISEK